MQFKNIVTAIAIMAVGNTMAAPTPIAEAEAIAVAEPVAEAQPEAVADLEARNFGVWGNNWQINSRVNAGAGAAFHGHKFSKGRFQVRINNDNWWFPQGATWQRTTNQFFLGRQRLCRFNQWKFYDVC